MKRLKGRVSSIGAMQPDLPITLHSPEPDKRAGTRASTFSDAEVLTQIYYLAINFPRTLPNRSGLRMCKYRRICLKQIFPEKTPDIYGSVNIAAGRDKNKRLQERMAHSEEPDKFIIVAFNNRAC
jgi:hypothetical protein